MSAPSLSATIFGARGSLPNPSVHTRRFGGATTCMVLRTPDQIPIVIDGGSGIFDFGLELSKARPSHREIHLFFTHTHWDHVQGLPFFSPFYDPRYVVHIYSLGERRMSVREIFEGVYAQRFFPVPFEQLDASIVFHELGFFDEVRVGATTVKCCRVNHPGYALGFRVEHGGRSIFFASDTAPFSDMLFGDRFHVRERDRDGPTLKKMQELQEEMERYVRGADILFHDANYTDDEYKRLFHFGHASMSQTYGLAVRTKVKRAVFWHHDRGRTDEALDALVRPFEERAKADGLIVEAARQGATYELSIE